MKKYNTSTSKTDIKGVMAPSGKITVDLSEDVQLRGNGAVGTPILDINKAHTYESRLVAYDYAYEDMSTTASNTVSRRYSNFTEDIGSGVAKKNFLAGMFSGGVASLPTVNTTNRRVVHKTGTIKAENNAAITQGTPRNPDDQKMTLTFTDYVISSHFPDRYINQADVSVSFDVNTIRYFAAAALLVYVPMDTFGKNEYKDYRSWMNMSATLYVEKISVDEDGNGLDAGDYSVSLGTARYANYTEYYYPPGTMEIYTHITRAAGTPTTDFGQSISLSGRRQSTLVGDGLGSIAYNGRFGALSSVSTTLSVATAYGGTEMIQKWNPNVARANRMRRLNTAYSSLLPDYTNNVKAYYGTLNSEQYDETTIQEARRRDYTWYPINNFVNVPNAAGTSSWPIADVPPEANGKKVSAILVEDFNVADPGAEKTFYTELYADQNYPTGVYNDDTMGIYTWAVRFRETRTMSDYADINNITNDPFEDYVYYNEPGGRNGYLRNMRDNPPDNKMGTFIHPSDDQKYTASSIADDHYAKTYYDDDGTPTAGGAYNNPGEKFADTVLVLPYKVSITKTVKNTAGAAPAAPLKTAFMQNEQMHWQLAPTFAVSASSSDADVPEVEVTVTDKIPQGLVYVNGSARQRENGNNSSWKPLPPLQQGRVDAQGDSYTLLIWHIMAKPGRMIEPIEYSTDVAIDLDFEKDDRYKLPTPTPTPPLPNLNVYDPTVSSVPISEVAASRLNRAEISIPQDKSEISSRTGMYTVTVNKMAGIGVRKRADKYLTDMEEEFKYTLQVYATTEEAYGGARVLDILPYNGDGRGSDFTGTYSVALELPTLPPELESRDPNLKVYYTTQPSVGISSEPPKETALATDAKWTHYTGGALPPGVTALALTYGRAISKADDDVLLPIEVTLTPSGNSPGDIYGNQCFTNSDMNVLLRTGIVTTGVVARNISGRAWVDTDGNGRQDAGEPPLGGVKVQLFKYDGVTHTPVFQNIIEAAFAQTTKADGTYQFNYLPHLTQGVYRVGFDLSDPMDKDYAKTIYRAAGVPNSTNSDAGDRANTNGGNWWYMTGDDYAFKATLDMDVLVDEYVNIDAGFISNSLLTAVKKAYTGPGLDVDSTDYADYVDLDINDTGDAAKRFIKYEIEVTNSHSTAAAHNVTVTDMIPDGTVLDTTKPISADYTTFKANTSDTVEHTYIQWKDLTIAANGGKATRYFTVRVLTPANVKMPEKTGQNILPGGVTSAYTQYANNTAYIGGPAGSDYWRPNNPANEPLQGEPTGLTPRTPTQTTLHKLRVPHVTGTKTSVPPTGSRVPQGGAINYTVRVKNDGDANAYSVVVIDPVPVGTTVASIGNGGVLVPNGGAPYIKWVVPYVKIGEDRTVTFTVTANPLPAGVYNAKIKNKAYIGGDDGDPFDPANPLDTGDPEDPRVPTTETEHDVVKEVPKGSLSALKDSVPARGREVEPGNEITYTI
ncbi:MAG: DUF11 domain-containing protein, partial [Oscillospiraceae bacterium]|nr:DUF11 domain-containing protein [Oscillospiraceae bacterium]